MHRPQSGWWPTREVEGCVARLVCLDGGRSSRKCFVSCLRVCVFGCVFERIRVVVCFCVCLFVWSYYLGTLVHAGLELEKVIHATDTSSVSIACCILFENVAAQCGSKRYGYVC